MANLTLKLRLLGNDQAAPDFIKGTFVRDRNPPASEIRICIEKFFAVNPGESGGLIDVIPPELIRIDATSNVGACANTTAAAFAIIATIRHIGSYPSRRHSRVHDLSTSP